MYQNYPLALTLKRLGGGGGGVLTNPQHEQISLHCFITFFFEVSRIFWDQNCGNHAYRYEATPLFRNACQPEIGSILWFCVHFLWKAIVLSYNS